MHEEKDGEEEMFLVRKKKAKTSHIWEGDDTACRMASTGGLDRSRYRVVDTSLGLPMCFMCKTVAKSRGLT